MQPPPESAHRRASSSSACSTAQRRTSVGCMAGLLRLFSPYQRSHHWKRLTAKLQPCSTAAPPPPSSTPSKKKTEAGSPSPVFLSPVKTKPMQQPQQPAVTQRRRSCDDAPRSPTIALEHRRFSCDSSRPPPTAIVARLMGLEESAPVVVPTRPPPPSPSPPLPAAPETAVEKRRKLLGALEKCDEDLKTLRRIIAAVRAAEMRAAAAAPNDVATMSSATTPPPGNKGSRKLVLGSRDERPPSPSPSPQKLRNKPRAGKGYQYPSPDSVLGAVVTSPRFPCRKRGSPCSTEHDAQAVSSNGAGTTKVVKPSRTFVLSGDYCKTEPAGDEQHAAVGAHHLPAAAPAEAGTLPARLPRAESWRLHQRRWELEAAAAGRVIYRAMVESVSEAWGQRWECGWVAAALEPAILQDLVTDVVAELLAQSGYHGHGDAAGSRRRLCF